METNKEEALKAIENGEKLFGQRDFAVKAKTLCPGLEGISQMMATFEVYIAAVNEKEEPQGGDGQVKTML
ncbi:hypothetical protein Lalb_Chr04g0247531 [Lupinus albus]|uniref:Uncharacterized protein n=1 Tax=Lupinus albus TaxID=3870 RepID=A0A6A4QNY8_LUPAL|nr:hypothetical protein Lalb_Chr04g0247331 [Lupinus albus]KAE9614704.1 hypothetical protein Lalb_Chr04g0247531 [Lupinus albus]